MVAAIVLFVGILCAVGGDKVDELEAVSNEHKSNRNLIIALVCLVFVAFGVIFAIVSEINKQRDEMITDGTFVIEDRGVLAWVDHFTNREFGICDMLVGSQDYRFYAPLIATRARDKRYYEKAIRGAVDCIVDVGLISVEDGDYKFQVRYRKYEQCTVDVDSVQNLRGRYMTGSVTDATFNKELADFYYDVFSDSCFRLSDDVDEFTFVFKELEHEGLKYVSGSVEFVDLLLELSGLSANFVEYEETVKSEVTALLKLGFEDG